KTFCDGREAIRRERSVRDDVMFSRIVLVMVNSQHDGEVFIFGGAEMMTFFTGPRICFLASAASVNRPVDSITTWAPTDSQGSLAGSFSANTRMFFSPTLMEFSPAVILCGRLPRIESFMSKCARVFGSISSLHATNSIW